MKRKFNSNLGRATNKVARNRARRENADISIQERESNAAHHRAARQNQEFRQMEQRTNTEAHSIARQSHEFRQMEQRMNTEAHQRSRLTQLRLAFTNNSRIGAVYDVQYFREADYPENERAHVLPSLYESGRICTHCDAHCWIEERKGFCCESGKVKIDKLERFPEEFKEVFKKREFLQNIRAYNNALAMASIGIREHQMPGFRPIVKVQGKVHHLIGTLLPQDDKAPKFAQIWFYDSANETANRLRHNNGLNVDILSTLQAWLRENNPYIQSLKSAIELMESGSDIRVVLDARKRPTGEHARRYNLPEASEVAVIIPGEHVDNLDVILHGRNGNLERIHELNRSYDPLHYVLLFPNGEEGYKLEIPHEKGHTKVTISEFSRFRLQVRNIDVYFNQVMRCRRLTQQFACDQYAKAESARLRWTRLHQKEIKADKYQGLMDAVDHNEELQAGTKIILPPTIYGSPHWYAEAFQDAMAIVRSLGKPDLFVTFTCNPRWPEVINSLLPGEQPSDRPDITARVFHIKLTALLKDLTKHGVLGRVTGYFGMKEDQKRGLPHCHILLILADDDKPREPQDIDRIVSAEIPDIVTNPRLHDIVTRNNIHGPCGCINQNSPCMSGQGTSRKCEKEFPQKFISDTIVADSTYPQYRRRSPAQGGLQHVKKVRGQYVQFDNSWVVPYNPFLTLKYNAHINVEIVNSVSSVKYIYKYVTKGSDRVTVRLANGEERDITNDEIECFVDARYISASEAYWREYGFSIQHKYPPVDKLPIHLEDEQFVLFQPGDARNIVANGPPTTKLTEFFRLNQESEEQLNITYPDVYKYFRWVSKKWKKRVNIVGRINRDREENEASSDMIGRIPVINLSARQSELFHLRMLLHTVPGPKSYEDLRTFNSVVHPTYQAACLAMGLLDDDSEVDRAMEEAASIRFGPSLREMFALILVFIKPADPVQFWDKHRHLLMEDIMQNNNLTEMNEAVIHTTLLEIQTIVQRHGLDLERDFRFPKPDRELAQQLHQLRILEEEISYDVTELKEYVETNRPLLNTEQQAVVDMAMDSVENGKGLLISLDAPGGTGKTFVLSLLLAQVRSQKKVALATATSGIAATLLPNGRTLHSRCKVPLSIKDDSMCSISKRDSTGKLIMQCHLMVIDEVSMCDRRILEAIDRTFRDLRDSHRPYGGITMIFSGDWRQILPVVRRGGRADTVAVTLKQSIIWNDVKVMKLKTNMRVRAVNGDEQFAEELLQIGEGRIPVDQELGQFKIKINEEYLINGSNLRCLTDVIYGNLSTLHNDCEWLCSRTILCPTNDAVDEVNDLILRQFPGNQMMYMSSDKILDVENSHQYPVEFLNSICASGMPPHRVCIKKGSPIMLLRNFDPKNGHCNGSRYIVENLMSNVIDARLATGPHAGKRLFIPRIPIVPSENLFPFQMQRRQFPIRLCFAMTANKSQGQTLKKVGIYLKNDFFSHGQLYVAMSRVGSRENVKLFTRNGYVKKKKAAFTNNVVYPEVL